ncbi:zinc-ribbon domain-containing protein [Lactobacillus selangorensis]|uniref:zinc-ribbon domain-containing protein n=1 Tax=Lactobacillus selangorensis TaxID=81857 RepID=UPI0007111FEB|nr:zinc-ribbon domain-containing protein [Lactobacillus selangorensis]
MSKYQQVCPNCGAKIPKKTTVCPYCGAILTGAAAAQPNAKPKIAASWTKVKPKARPHGEKWYRNPWILVTIAIFALFGMWVLQKISINHDSAAHMVQTAVLDGHDDYKGATAKWNQKANSVIVTIPASAPVLQNFQHGKLKKWNTLVQALQKESSQIAGLNNGVSNIQVLNPQSHRHVILQIKSGKVAYNVSDDL